MIFSKTRKYKHPVQILISILVVIVAATICFISKNYIGYRVVALLLLMTVSILAMLFDIVPVLVAAILSAIVWNFFFIPPLYTFHINDTEDILMFFMYFAIALVNAALTIQIRREEKNVRDKEEKDNTIKLYKTLLNSLSHELRTPISTIIGAVDTLKDSKDRLSTDNQTELLNQIEIAAVRLNKQVENLLNMSRLETGLLKLNLGWCDINELLNLIIQKAKSIARDRKLIFIPDEDIPICKIDEGIVEQAVQNIVSNAIHYTPENAAIKIIATVEENKLNIRIEDDGNGIPEEYLKDVFKKFFRLPNTKAGGTGLGLSISKGFIKAHGGDVHIENIQPHGARFIIQIPVETSYINKLKNE
jgi:two-component system, OmpR family, sensor histidine kinase KdpD